METKTYACEDCDYLKGDRCDYLKGDRCTLWEVKFPKTDDQNCESLTLPGQRGVKP